MTLQQRIRSLRKERGLSQEALAEALGVSRQAVTKWEDGSALPSTANLLALADFFAVPLEDFVRPAAQEEAEQEKGTEATPQRSQRKTAVRVASGILILSNEEERQMTENASGCAGGVFYDKISRFVH